MSTLISQKCYTMSRKPIMFRDLQVQQDGHSVFTIAFSSTGALYDTSRSLRIHEKGLMGPVLCTAVTDKQNSLTVRLPGLTTERKHREYQVQHCSGGELGQDEFRLKLSDAKVVAWKKIGAFDITISANSVSKDAQMVTTRKGDWKLVATRVVPDANEEDPGEEEVLAVYVQTGSGRKITQKACLYFFTSLDMGLELASLAAVMALQKRTEPESKHGSNA